MRRVWVAPFVALVAVLASAAIVLADLRPSRAVGGAAAHHIPKPRIVWDPIPFGAKRKAETVAYVRRHYGSFMKPTWRLVHPHVIVIHYTDGPSFSSAWNTFADDVPDSELHELPGTCAHFIVDTNGTIYQLVSVGTICRHTVGLNWTAFGIEHVGYSDGQVLGNSRQMSSSLRLVRWLRCRFKIPIKDVIGHNESLSSPYHHEDVPSLRTQTHDDFNRHDMRIYRHRLGALGGC
jgi:N-acetylmuramoyl-L-alanine amidase